MSFHPIFAQTADGGSSFLLLIVLMGGLLFFTSFQQRRRRKAVDELQSSLQVGDDVRTIGGIIGRIVSMDDDTVVLEVETGRISFTRRAIAERTTAGE